MINTLLIPAILIIKLNFKERINAKQAVVKKQESGELDCGRLEGGESIHSGTICAEP